MRIDKKKILIIAVVFIVLAGLIFILRSQEDDWIKDSRGVWVKHGAPSSTPDEVLNQQNAIECANNLYNGEMDKGSEFDSQCLGSCYDFAVDIVHVPRSDEDNLVENQCEAYRSGQVNHFIELDKEGNIVRIV